MTDQELRQALRRLYWLTGSFGIIGFVSYFWLQGPRPAFAFLSGAVGSFGNLWLFEWLSRALAPSGAPRRPWKAGAFISRYLVLITAGYVIVKALKVNGLAVVLGLLASTAGVLLLSVVEIAQSLSGNKRAH